MNTRTCPYYIRLQAGHKRYKRVLFDGAVIIFYDTRKEIVGYRVKRDLTHQERGSLASITRGISPEPEGETLTINHLKCWRQSAKRRDSSPWRIWPSSMALPSRPSGIASATYFSTGCWVRSRLPAGGSRNGQHRRRLQSDPRPHGVA